MMSSFSVASSKVSKSLISVSSIKASSLKGKPITKIYKAYDETNQRWLADCIMNYLKQGSYSMPSNDIILYNADDDIIDISQTIAPIQDSDDNVLGTITTFQDISKEKRLNRYRTLQYRA